MSHRWKITVIVVAVAVAAIISTPTIWLLGSPDAGRLAGASVQAATGVAALLWAVLSGPATPARAGDEAVHTGTASARAGGRAITGIKRSRGRGRWPGKALRTGRGMAIGEGSEAVTGIDYT